MPPKSKPTTRRRSGRRITMTLSYETCMIWTVVLSAGISIMVGLTCLKLRKIERQLTVIQQQVETGVPVVVTLTDVQKASYSLPVGPELHTVNELTPLPAARRIALRPKDSVPEAFKPLEVQRSKADNPYLVGE